MTDMTGAANPPSNARGSPAAQRRPHRDAAAGVQRCLRVQWASGRPNVARTGNRVLHVDRLRVVNDVIWRLGPVGMIVVGIALLAISLSGIDAAAVSIAALTLGAICLVAGVVRPRTRGKFTFGPQGVSTDVLPVEQIPAGSVRWPDGNVPPPGRPSRCYLRRRGRGC